MCRADGHLFGYPNELYMGGIVFFRTERRDQIVDFYCNQIGMEVWLEQEAGCTILQHENILVGFCDGDKAETDGIITILVKNQKAVDQLADKLGSAVEEPPTTNDAFDIYQCFATDPEGRTVEIQTFLHPVSSVEAYDPGKTQ